MTAVHALYMKKTSTFRRFLPKGNVWTARRDARNYPGGFPVVAAPPCERWCKLSGLSTANTADLAFHALGVVRAEGGVLEHPAHSKFWRAAGLPVVGSLDRDRWGGYSLAVDQWRFGHIAQKLTWLYIVGAPPARVLAMLPPPRHYGGAVVKLWTDGVNRMWRDQYPLGFAMFLFRIAVLAGDFRGGPAGK